MNTSANKFDAIEQLIFEDGIRIKAVDFHREDDIMLLVLNARVVLRFSLSSFASLKNASNDALINYELIGGGTGIHWPELDEDLSLKGFLQLELKRAVNDIAA